MLWIEGKMCMGDSCVGETISKLGIVIVDDAEEVRRDLKTVLQLAPDLEVLAEAVNGIEAIDVVERLRPDIVLMDLRLPGLDGFEATEQIKKRGLAGAVIMLTIYDQLENRVRAETAGVDRFLGKGLGVEHLVAAIRQVGQASTLGPTAHSSGHQTSHKEVNSYDGTL